MKEHEHAVMVIACPHALGLAVPLVVAVSTARAAKNGWFIRNRVAFEGARKLSVNTKESENRDQQAMPALTEKET